MEDILKIVTTFVQENLIYVSVGAAGVLLMIVLLLFIKRSKSKKKTKGKNIVEVKQKEEPNKKPKKAYKLNKKIDDTNRFEIKPWQDNLLYGLFEKIKEESGLYGLWEDEKLSSSFLKYMNDQSEWNRGLMEEYHDGLTYFVSLKIFERIKELLSSEKLEDNNEIVVLLYTMDIINGFFDYKGKGSEWIDVDSFTHLVEYPTLSSPVKRAYNLLYSLVVTAEKTFTSIITSYVVNESSKRMTNEEIYGSLDRLINETEVEKIDKQTQNVMKWYLVDYIDIYLFEKRRTFKQLDLSYLRTLAMIIDKKDYNDIIESID